MRRIKVPVGVKLFIAIWLAALCVPTVREISRSLSLLSQSRANAVEVNQSVPNALLSEFPNEPIVVGWGAENAFYGNKRNVMKDAFARFPDDLPLRALRLKTTAYDMPHVDKKRNGKDAFHEAEYAKAAQIAREGGKREPDNAFWPWMEAAFDFSIGQDDAALKAFERISNCSRFDDYDQQSVKARLEFWEQHGNPTFDQKVSQLFLSGLLPHLTALRESGELASARAAQLRKDGENARAINVENGVLNAMRLIRRDSSSISLVFLGESGARDSLGKLFSIAKPRQSENYVDPAIYGSKLMQAWAVYVRKNGRPELADNANFVGEPSSSREWGEYFGDMGFAQFGFNKPWGTIATAGPMALLVLAAAIWLGAIGWALATLLRWGDQLTSRGQAVACANFSFWLLLGICVLVIAKFSLFLNPFVFFDGAINPVLIVVYFFGSTLLCWVVPVWFVSWNRARRNTTDERKASKGYGRWAAPLLWGIALIGLGALVSGLSQGILFFDQIVRAILTMLALAGALFATWKTSPNNFRLQLAHRTLGILVVAWSFAFLCCSIGLIPLRAQLNRNFDRQVQIGEIAWMREQIAKTK